MTPLAVAAHTLAALRSEVPVDPDAETARRWAQAELADPIYHQRESLLQMLLRWVMDQLEAAQEAAGNLDLRAVTIVAVLVLAAAVGAVLFVSGPVGRARRARRTSTEVFVDDTRTADELRTAADACAARGQWSAATLERFRAVLRSLEERALLDPRPGRTAREGASEGGRRLPARASELAVAGRLFDDVRYGDAEATEADDMWLRQVDQAVAATRPAQVEATVVGDAFAVPR